MTVLKKKLTQFRPLILSRHPSHNILRVKEKLIATLPYRSVIRFGSTTEVPDSVSKGGNRIEINTIQAIKNSASKLLMKQKFMEAGVKTAEWLPGATGKATVLETIGFPMVIKAHYGSKGRGNTLIKNEEDWNNWWNKNNSSANYIFEKFMNYALEYRLHITEDGCFYTCRKALKSDVPEDQKWRRHDDICVWFLEESEHFLKPNSWKDIESDCVKALKAIGADILSFDVRVQGPLNSQGGKREYQDYILLECNSASSMDNGKDKISVCAQKYIDIIPKVIIKKANK